MWNVISENFLFEALCLGWQSVKMIPRTQLCQADLGYSIITHMISNNKASESLFSGTSFFSLCRFINQQKQFLQLHNGYLYVLKFLNLTFSLRLPP